MTGAEPGTPGQLSYTYSEAYRPVRIDVNMTMNVPYHYPPPPLAPAYTPAINQTYYQHHQASAPHNGLDFSPYLASILPSYSCSPESC